MRSATADLDEWDPSILILVAEDPEEMEWLHERTMIVEQTTKLKGHHEMVSKYKRLPMPHDVIESMHKFVMVWALNNSLLVNTSFHTALSIMSSQGSRVVPCDWSTSGWTPCHSST